LIEYLIVTSNVKKEKGVYLRIVCGVELWDFPVDSGVAHWSYVVDTGPALVHESWFGVLL